MYLAPQKMLFRLVKWWQTRAPLSGASSDVRFLHDSVTEIEIIVIML